MSNRSNDPKAVLCFRCHGKGTEPTALDLFDQLAGTLKSLMWPDERIVKLKEELKTDDVLAGMPRWGVLNYARPTARYEHLSAGSRVGIRAQG